ncbi:MAG: phosphatase domain-containing protein, partial [Longimicrobiales bacterium]
LTILEAFGDSERIEGTAPVLVPSSEAEFGVVSDVDDTVLRSHVTNRLLFARAVLLRNARSRPPLAGVAELYRALEAGPDGRGRNPVFYVSLTAWNLYDVLEACLAVHDVPLGPLMLRDRGLNASVAPRDKVDRALELFALYPTLPFVLIGDSGQGDPESYLQVVRRAPGRVLAVYIRDVSPERRDREVHAVAGEVASYGVPMVLVGDSAAAARHARERGLITGAALDRVAAAVRAETG